MLEKYGIIATPIASLATTPVTLNTEIVFIGAASCIKGSTHLTNAPYLEAVKCSSLAEYEELFGDSVKHLGLCDAARAAFMFNNIDHAWFINCNNPKASTIKQDEADITGEEILDGVAVLDDVFMSHGVVPNIVCVPWFGLHEGNNPDDNFTRICTACTQIADKFKAQLIIDAHGETTQISEYKPVIDEIEGYLYPPNECAVSVWGAPILSISGDGDITDYISGAAYVACLRAVQDSINEGGLPSRSVGNLYANAVKGVCIRATDDGSNVYGPFKITNSVANDIQELGLVTWLNIGSNRYVTWGDHTTAYRQGFVEDERARFDSGIALMYHLANRFVLKWRNIIDDAFTLDLRNAIVAEETDYLSYCVAAGALIGSPRCEFKAIDNTTDTAAQGQFYFTDIYTHAIPAKYIELKLQYTDEGLKVYNIE